jgi:drug/metabolite transporter (DMT)-like permease
MHPLLFLTVHDANRLKELAAALIAVAGVVMLLGAMAPMGRRGSQWLAGLALAVAGVLAVVALHWGGR